MNSKTKLDERLDAVMKAITPFIAGFQQPCDVVNYLQNPPLISPGHYYYIDPTDDGRYRYTIELDGPSERSDETYGTEAEAIAALVLHLLGVRPELQLAAD